MAEEDIVEVTDQSLFEQATSSEAPAAETPPAQEAAAEPKTDKTGRLHDDKGRFAPKVGDATPQAEAQSQVAAEQPGAVKPEPKAEEPHRVPLRELLDEREKRQQLANELAQMRAWQQQVVATQRQAAMRAQQPQDGPNIIDNPDAYLAQRVVGPMQQWGQHQIRMVKDQMSYEMAKMQPGGEQAISEALAEIRKIGSTPEMQFAYQQIMSSGHPYAALIQWHQEHKNRQLVGADPKAWFEKQLEEKKKDPAFQAEIVKLIQGQQNRPPVVNLPPSLSSVPAAAGRADEQGDLSDASLFNYAIR